MNESSSLRRPPAAVVIAVLVMAAKVVASVPRLDVRSAPLVLITWGTVAAFLVIGLVLFRTAVPKVNAWACLLVAATAVPGDLAEAYYRAAWLTPVGYVLEQGYLPAAVALALRYPSSRLTRSGRLGVAALGFSTMGLRLPQVFTAGSVADGFHAPPGWPVLVRSDLVHDWLLYRGSLVLTIGGLIWVGSGLLRRARAARGVARQSLLPVSVVGMFAALFAGLEQATRLSPVTAGYSWVPAMVRDLSAAGLPVALIGDLLRRRSAGAAVALQVVSAAQSGQLQALQVALAEALADPSLEVWLAEGEGWVRADGVRAGRLPEPAGRRVERVVDTVGRPLCAVSVDALVVQDEELFSSALRAARLGVENDRLRAQLLERMAEIEDSRERIVEAGAAERRRVERDLHDGAQQQLLAVMASLSRAGVVEDPDEVREVVSGARSQLVSALAELRRLARGIHPATLSQGGLSTALPGLAETAVVPTRVTLGKALQGRRFRTSVESTAYFVVAEALTNVGRHARAEHTEVAVDLHDGADGEASCLRITVLDDGRGGALLRPDGGLAGLRDRVQALGGSLDVSCGPQGRGTLILALLPIGAGAA
jgi:signal transduction histidine kinase